MAHFNRLWVTPVLLLTTSSAAPAATLTAQQILQQFNAVIFNNFTTRSGVEGRTVVGGDMTGGASFDINLRAAQTSAYGALTVWGNQTSSTQYNINNGGDSSPTNNAGVVVGGSNAGGFTLNGYGDIYVGGASTNAGKTLSAARGNVTAGGGNSGDISAGGSVFINGTNSGTINAGTGTVSINGTNTGTINNASAAVKINGDTGNVSINNAPLTYSGNKTGSVNATGSSTVTHASVTLAAPASPLGAFAATFKDTLTALSTSLKNVAADGKSTAASGLVSGTQTETITARPNASGQAVLAVNTSYFQPNSNVVINLNGATSVIINVNVDTCSGTTCNYTFASSTHFMNDAAYADKVVWNFANATGLNFNTMFGGTVLAPLASVTNVTPIEGTLIAASFTGGGELHSYSYTGSFPSSGSTSVPEPSSALLFGLAFAALSARRR